MTARKLALMIGFSAVLGFSAASLQAKPAGFFISSLPRGKDVTLPRPAITYVPLNDRVTVSATDMPQTIKLTSVNLNDGKALPVRVAIYDSKATSVRHIDLKPGLPYLYTFKDVGSVALVPEAPKGVAQSIAQYGLRLESDKPLGLGR